MVMRPRVTRILSATFLMISSLRGLSTARFLSIVPSRTALYTLEWNSFRGRLITNVCNHFGTSFKVLELHTYCRCTVLGSDTRSSPLQLSHDILLVSTYKYGVDDHHSQSASGTTNMTNWHTNLCWNFKVRLRKRYLRLWCARFHVW